MIPLAFRVWVWLTKLLTPMLPAIMGVMAALLIIQTVRIEGISIWPIHIPGLKAERDDAVKGRAADKALYTTAQKVADSEWNAKLAKAQADYDAKAAQGDKDHEQLSRDYAALAADYKQRMRIPPAQGATGHVQAATDSHGASVPQTAPAAPLVAVTDADIDTCTAAVAYGDAAHAWALSLPQEK